jgi:hypothetical protein
LTRLPERARLVCVRSESYRPKSWLWESDMFLRRWLAIALVLLVAASTGLAKERVWTSADGRSMRGEFVRELDGEVTFLVDGKLVTIALDRLSEADQQKVRDLAAGKEIPDDPVPAAAATVPPPNTQSDDSQPASPAAPSADEEAADKETEPAKPGSVPSLARKPRTAPAQRVWTDNQGRQSTARFVRVFGSKVVLSRGSTPITVEFFDLSAADQAYIRDLLTSRGEEELIPPEPLTESPAGDEGTGSPTPDAVPAAGAGDGTVPRSGPGIGSRPPGPSGRGPGGLGPGSRIRGPGGSGGAGSSPRGPGMSGPSGPFGPGMSGIGPGGPRGPGFSPGPPGMDSSAGRGTGFGPGFGPGGFGPGPRIGPESPLASGPAIAPVPGTDGSGLNSAPVGTTPPPYAPPPIAYQPPASPPVPTFTRVPMCSSCRKQVTDEQAKGTTCPHCGARWQFNQYANASNTTSSNSGAGLMPMSPAEAEKTVRSVVLVVAILGVVVVLVGGIILAALAIASASRPRKPTYQQPYRPYQ